LEFMTKAYHALNALPRGMVPESLLPIFDDNTGIYVPGRLPAPHHSRAGRPLMIPAIESSRMAALFIACSPFAVAPSSQCGCDSSDSPTFAECLAIPRVVICRSLGGSLALPFHGACAECVYHSGVQVGGEICDCGIVGRARGADDTRLKIQYYQSSLMPTTLSVHMRHLLTPRLGQKITRLTRYLQELRVEIAQLETNNTPVSAVTRTSLADHRGVVGL
jgi:hypothetical protein